MKNSIIIVFAFAFLSFVVTSCVDTIEGTPLGLSELELPETPYNYTITDVPSHVENLVDNTPIDNQLTDHGATLGRVLFYEKAMSKNNTIACASCHEQALGFAQATAFSEGFEGQMTTRNSMAIANHRYTNQFFWDSDRRPLEQQVIQPIQNHIEMGLELLDDLVIKIDAIPYYDELFTNAFGSAEVSQEKIEMALAQFIRSMVSANSKFDRAKAADNDFALFTTIEKEGMEIFEHEAPCGDCHRTDHDFGPSWRDATNIGLDMNYADQGAGNGRFKIPSLRNIAVTGPYMHDGRYETLEEVINFYDNDVQSHPDLDWSLTDRSWDLTSNEKQALKAFLMTLTDEQYLTDPKFSDPFID